jgi:aspartate aminotransferase
MKAISTRLSNIPPSATVAVDNKVGMLRAAGRDIISLGGGEPSFDTPQHIVEAAFEAIRSGATGYAVPSTGTKPAKSAIAAKFERDSGLVVNPETQIIVTPGGKWAINLALAALINPGDEVLVLEPAWVSFRSMIQLHGGVPVSVSLSNEDNFKISADSLRAKVSHKTKAIIVNSPCNPTARVLSREEVEALVTIVNQFDLYVVFDELYEQLIFEGQHFPLVSEPCMAERTITVNGLSKAYAMTGWRLGWLVAPEPIVKLAAKLHSQTITCATTYGCAGGCAQWSARLYRRNARRLPHSSRLHGQCTQ